MIGIVILNYNTWDESIHCVESIAQTTNVEYRVYLVDNQSPIEAAAAQLQRLRDMGVIIIVNPSNNGYAAGNNVGLKRAYDDGCDMFLISNSDVLFQDDSIAQMYRFASENQNVGVVGPIIYDLAGTQQPIHMICRLTAVGKIKNMMLHTPLRALFKSFEQSFVMHRVPDQPLKVFGVSGCCLLITKDCYEKVFPYDEHTFLYEEEVILGVRMEDEGIDTYVLPTAHIIHAEAVATGGMSAFSYNCLVESEQYYLKEYIHSSLFMRGLLKAIRKVNWHLIYKK